MTTPPETYRLTQITGFLRRVLALNFSEPLWLAAELAQVSSGRGHRWLTLVQKDEEKDEIVAQLEGVVWENTLRDLRRRYGLAVLRGLLQSGMSVRLRVRMSFHERFGMRLVVEDIDPEHTVGALERRRQQTLERLAAEQLLTENAGKYLPPVPLRLAVISSQTAAGWADFSEQLSGNPYGYIFKTKLFAAAMQGARTSPEIIARLREIDRFWRDRFDAVVIVRGGGGRTDLAAFDEEQLCRAVAGFSLPVVVGVGHETDETVLDRVAFRSLKTPTAAATYLVETVAAAEAAVLLSARRVALTVTQIIAFERPARERLATGVRQAAAAGLRTEEQQLDRLSTELRRLPGEQLGRAAEQLLHRAALLTALRPETTLDRGFALVSQGGRLITAPEQVARGELDVRLREGSIRLVTE